MEANNIVNSFDLENGKTLHLSSVNSQNDGFKEVADSFELVKKKNPKSLQDFLILLSES